MSSIRYKTEENCDIKWSWWAERTALTSIIYHWAYIIFTNSAFYWKEGIKEICSFFVIILFYVEVMLHRFADAYFQDADVLLIVGANPRYEAPLVNARIRKA